MSIERIPLDDFKEHLAHTSGAFLSVCDRSRTQTRVVELSSLAIGGRIVAVSDEFFAEAVNLLRLEVKSLFTRAHTHL